ncbi:NADH dehydrogenase (ubiquinone) complex I, assembly factor 6 isoform X1 [Schistocerca piceifrons]|uniref:NADH dehydrogenase (ubiquinone) complex I, assembly factor 6 isoform X1 n=1 Tax=Schistocerca piceifrons TaxID=274613 RepID=UPI001F5FBE86|nr:NADH dehydrogenase (ubiquinone) complex I, assembly factor 6 isoform X1 [Schistocerca piceifrons]XP_047109052.1 NADH dehydrogenase (ubiquinone) complex I, assembly factor 6 isoform X1 [Schistocerca piceifrons]XP_047109053.1 NADH dehydrogenase (ubiquinone) complex I, assembly factor 6 isoform X1 [Schistocerca piceifrons]
MLIVAVGEIGGTGCAQAASSNAQMKCFGSLRRTYGYAVPRSEVCKKSLMKYSTSKETSSGYCVNMVKNFDYENFLCTLLLPNDIRTSAFAIRAFNIETARVQDSVSDPRIGQMRLKFWEETIDKIYNGHVPKQPVASELYRAIKRHTLSKRHLKRLILARSNHFSTSFLSLDEMESYAEESTSPVYYMLLEALGIKNIHADHAASHLGKAQGLTNMVRSVPHCAERRLAPPLPQDVMMEKGVSQEEIIRGSSSDNTRDIIFTVAARASQHLEKARSIKTNLPEPAFRIFLPGVPVGQYLEKLRLLHFDVFDAKLQRRNSLLPLALYWNRFRMKF